MMKVDRERAERWAAPEQARIPSEDRGEVLVARGAPMTSGDRTTYSPHEGFQ